MQSVKRVTVPRSRALFGGSKSKTKPPPRSFEITISAKGQKSIPQLVTSRESIGSTHVPLQVEAARRFRFVQAMSLSCQLHY